MPRTLEETYERILLNINEEYCSDAIKVLQWLAFSARPVTLVEVAEALAVDFTDTIPRFDPDQRMPDPQDILFICSSLVSTSSQIASISRTVYATNGGDADDQGEFTLETEELRLAHFSVKEYLIGVHIQNSTVSQYGFNGKIANRHIAQTCLAYLFQFDKMDSFQLQPPTYFPLAHYGAEFWMTHCKSQSEDTQIPDTVEQMIVHLFQPQSPQFVNWVRLFDVDKPWDRNQQEFSQEFSQELIASPLYYTSLIGLKEASWDLVSEKGADVNAKGGTCGNALQAASRAGHQLIVELLLGKGADVNAQGGKYGNALQAASGAGHQPIVELLLEKGADANAQGGYFGNALQAASEAGYQPIVQLLLEKGADVNAQGGYYGNAMQAASGAGHQPIVQLLLEKGADVNAQSGYFWNALQAASRAGHQPIVQLLLEKGADVNAQGGYYGNAIQAASGAGHQPIVELLLEKGADVNAQGGFCGNALQAASEAGHQLIVERLLKKGADVNAQGGYFGNALQAASKAGHQPIVQLLLERGADVDVLGGVGHCFIRYV